jgi:putative transcriptional regulator
VTKEVFLKQLGQHIAKKRLEAGYTQNAFALQCGMDRQNMSRLENGKINPTVYALFPIAKELGITVRDLLDF